MIRKEWIAPWLGPLAFAAVGLAIIAIAPRLHKEAEIARDVAQAAEAIRERYIEDVDADEVRYTALEGMMEALDPYSDYYRPDEAANLVEDNEGKFGGLGVFITMDEDNRLIIQSTIEGKPAFTEGLRSGDWIVAVDGTPLKGKRLDECSRLIKGEVGTEVNLTIRRPEVEEVLEFTVTRGEIEIASVKGAEIIDKAHGIGYVRIIQFQGNTPDEFDRAIGTLRGEGMNSLILDLRSNPGGVLDSAVDLAGRFLPVETLIVKTVGRDGDVREDLVEEDTLLPPFPLVVLVNDGSASSSEIVAAAIQDHGRGVLVGARTFGKASVQSLIRIGDDNALLKLTTAKYLTPRGRCIHRERAHTEEDEWGLHPDLPVRLDPEAFEKIRWAWATREAGREAEAPEGGAEDEPGPPADTQLEEALEVLRDPERYGALLAGAPPEGKEAPSRTAKGER